MSESLTQFRDCCLRAFAFLSEYGFAEVEPSEKRYNHYLVGFSNGEIQLVVKGEGYGTIASISYVNRDGIEVPSQFLEPTWEPDLRKQKRKKKPGLTQEQQILGEARRIQERDRQILLGDYSHLDAIGRRWKSIKEKLLGVRA